MTLIEVAIAMSVLALSMGGVFAVLMQSRRLTEGSVVQNSALTIMQGYIEQMKNMDLVQVVGGSDDKGNPVLNTGSYSIMTRLDDLHSDYLQTSTGTPPAISTLTPGVTPAGVVDNLKNFDVIRDSSATSDYSVDSTGSAQTNAVSWASVWPHALTYPAGNIGKTDLKLNVWVWVSDLSGTTAMAQKVYGITLIYTWQYADGNRVKYIIGSLRSVRSTVPTF